MEVDESDDADVVVLGFIARPIGETAGLNTLEGTFPRETFGTRVVGRTAFTIPFEIVRVVEINTFAEAKGSLLPVFAPQAVALPGVDVAVWVQGWDEDPVELFEEFGHFFGFAVGGDEGVGDVIDCACADPFAGMGAAAYDDGFARTGRFLGICGVDSNAEGRNIAAFVGYANVDHANVGGEEGAEEAHPGDDDRERSVFTEEDVGLVGVFGGLKDRAEWTMAVRGGR